LLIYIEDDFASDCDLYIACLILQKQIEQDDNGEEYIVIPSIKMKQISEQNGGFLILILAIYTFLFFRSSYS
jgi:hypothetical protein